MEKDADILSMYSDEDNSLWIGTSNGTLLNLNDKGLIRASFNIQKDISSMFEDHNGLCFLSSNSVIAIHDRRSVFPAKSSIIFFSGS